MGGAIGVSSMPARGSVFRFSVVLEALPGRRESAAVWSGARLLVVDDNETNRAIVVHQTQALGLAVEGVACGADAIDRLRGAAAAGRPFELALIDMKMPGMNGLELARCIEHDTTLGRPRKVLLTSLDCAVPSAEARAAGVAATLAKPARQHELKTVLVRALGVTPRAAAAAMPARLAPLSGRVLLAEDNAVNREVALSVLRALGCDVEVAITGLEVLDRMSRHRFDVVLMDCQMPEMDGYVATAELRTRGYRLPIVALTANALEGDREKALAAGMDDYIAKPFSRETLHRVLTRWLSAQRTQDIDPQALASLREFGDDDPAFAGRLVRLYIDSAPADIAALHDALARRDDVEVRRLAHGLKSSSARVGARSLAALCALIEGGARDADWSQLRSRAATLPHEFERAAAALRDALQAVEPSVV